MSAATNAEPLWQPWSLRDLVEDLARGATTPEAALRRSRDRIEATEQAIHAWRELDDTAGPSGGPGALSGVPFAVKDIIDLAGLPTRCGSALREDASPAATDAAIVRAWRSTGAVPIGKSVTTEFAFFAPGPTTNPANPAHTPGGSSSGSAAAVASGQVPLALGSQTAGSVTRPASYCGVAALVMTRGRFPTDGVAGLSPSLDSHGLYAATPDDLGVAWSALTGEVVVPTSRPPRILVWQATTLDVVSPAMSDALRSACERLHSSGATVDFVSDESFLTAATRAHPVVMAYEAARERAGELARADELSDPLANLLRTGASTSAESYTAAGEVIVKARATTCALLDEYDLILGPAAPSAAPRGLGATGDPVLSRAWQAFGLPQVTVPGLRDADGMPLGLQAIGVANRESDLLAWSDWIGETLTAPDSC